MENEEFKDTRLERKFSKWFLRALAGVLLVYFTYDFIKVNEQTGDITIGAAKASLLIFCVAVYLAIEVVSYYITKKLKN